MKKRLFIITIVLLAALPINVAGQASASDECNNAISVSIGCATPVTASTINATASPQFSTCAGTNADDDIWYSFIASASSMTISISNAVLQNSATADIGMAVYNGPCGDFAEVFCDGNIVSGNGEQALDGLVTGSRYLIRFWTTGNADQGSFDFCVQDMSVTPVKITAVGASCNNEKVVIQWTTVIEINNNFFTLEKSKDGRLFEILTSIKAEGNSSLVKNYSVVDAHPYPYQSRTWYRLKQTDINGRETSIKTFTASCNNIESKLLLAYPNPASNNLQIITNRNYNKGIIRVLTVTGTVIRSLVYSEQPGNIVNINLDNIAPGVYMAEVTGRNAEKQLIKFIKK